MTTQDYSTLEMVQILHPALKTRTSKPTTETRATKTTASRPPGNQQRVQFVSPWILKARVQGRAG
jgi:hypothetical protein